MAINCKDLNQYVIIPTLSYLGLYADNNRNLLLGTAAKESDMGTYLKQLKNGPAFGIFQEQDSDHTDIYNNFLFYRPELKARVDSLASPVSVYTNRNQELIVNLAYATAIAMIHYLRISEKREKVPDANNIPALASYWKRYYNTSHGKGTEEEFIENYNKYVQNQI